MRTTVQTGGWNLKAAWSGLETATKTVATLTAAIAILTFLIPPLGRVVNVLTAWRFGATGYVYYGINEKHEPTGGGQLVPLRAGDRKFDSLSWGDRLQVISNKRFREEAKFDGKERFLLNPGDCVIILQKEAPITDKKKLEDAVSAGWLWVATTTCGLFNK